MVVSERVKSGITGLDSLIEGGLVAGSTNLIAGQTGTGKSIFSMQFALQGARDGEPAVYLSMEQEVDNIISDMTKFGWSDEIRKLIDSGSLIVASATPDDMHELQQVSLQHIRKIKAKRFVLDSLSIATMGWKISSMDVGKIRNETRNYMDSLKNSGVTSVLITEIPEVEEKKLSRFGFEEFIADGIIKLNYLEYAVGGTPRSLIIRKMRRTQHGTDVYPIEFTKHGIVIKNSKA